MHDVCINPAVNKDHGWQLTYLKKVHHQGNFDPALFDNDVAGMKRLINFFYIKVLKAVINLNLIFI